MNRYVLDPQRPPRSTAGGPCSPVRRCRCSGSRRRAPRCSARWSTASRCRPGRASSPSGCSTPAPSTPVPTAGPYRLEDVTVVIPVKDRSVCELVARPRRRSSTSSSSTTRRRRPVVDAGRHRAAPRHQRRPGGRPQPRAGRRHHPARGLRRRRLPARAGLAGAAPAPLRRRPGRRRRPPGRQPRAARRRSALARYESVRSPLDLGADRGPGAGRHPHLLRARRRARGPHRRAPGRRRLRRGPALSARTSTSCGASTRAACGCATSRPPWSHHEPRPTLRAWLAQRASYGRSAADLAERHPGAVAAPRRQRVERGGVGPGRRRRARSPALATAGGTAAGPQPASCRTSTIPSGRRCGSPGTATCSPGGCWPSAITRAWWPVVVALALVSAPGPAGAGRRRPPARRWSTGSASDRRSTPCATSRCASLDDAAYGSGLWQGAIDRRTADPLLPDLTSWPRPSRYDRRPRRRDDPHPPRRRRRRGGRRRASHRSSAHGDVIAVVKGNGYGFGRAPAGRRGRSPSAWTRLAVGTVHELAGLPPLAEPPIVLTPALGADVALGGRRRPHRRLDRPRPRRRRPPRCRSW